MSFTSQSAAEQYEQMVRGSEERQRLIAARRGPAVLETGPARWDPGASRFREDPFRENETLTALLSYIQPNDTVLDIGGGAGRYLPIALRCREFVNVEPSAGMGTQFEASVQEAGIANAKWMQSDWMDADIDGDITFCANVVYYVADIVPFLEKLDSASRRRVMIVMHSLPPVNSGASLSHYVYGIDPILDPGQRDLLLVLWEMGILPDVQILGPSDFIADRSRFATREEAIAKAIPDDLLEPLIEPARAAVEEHFDELFASASEGGFRRRSASSRVVLVTWEPGRTGLRQHV